MKYRLDKALEILERTPKILNTYLENLSDEWIFCNEGEETWSAYDVVGHLIHGEKTGLSNRSVTNGIQELLDLNLIQTSDHIGNILSNPQQRKQAKRVYYSLIMDKPENFALYNEKTKEKHTQKMRSTKEISLPKYNANERIPDHIRLEQIKQEQELK